MDITDDRPGTRDDTLTALPHPRDRILRAAAALLATGGREAVSTRAVSAAAGVQPPTIYRQFGDMRGLLDAVVEDGFTHYLRGKIALGRTADPIADLRAGWDAHIDFGLANPALYTLMYGEPRVGVRPSAAIEAHNLLEELVRRVAEAGRLRVGVGRATRMIHAAGVGVILTLIAVDGADRDLTVATLTREAILAAVTTDPDATAPAEANAGAAHAIALKALLPDMTADFTPAERSLLKEWLERLTQES